MRARRPARHADTADHFSLADPVTPLETVGEAAEMRIDGCNATGVCDSDDVSVAAVIPCEFDHAIGRTANPGTGRRGKIHSSVRTDIAKERVPTRETVV
ncbi:MAG: hypothetical protein RL322_212 [Pseudomonadota bacterium]